MPAMLPRWFASCLLAVPFLCQEAPCQRALADLQRTFEQQWRALSAGEAIPSREQQQELLGRQAAELDQFLQKDAKGDDRWNGRLMLADFRAGLGRPDLALAALRAIDPAQAPGLVLLTAADLAARLGDAGLRGRWIDAALQRPAPLPERMAMARVLMTLLQEIDKGEALIAEAMAAAKDDAGRAEVRWHRAEALREREDLPENTYYLELEKLAKDLPDTYWGSVAKDRLHASQLAPGTEPVAFTATLRSGGKWTLAEQKGKAVLLVFWSAADPQGKVLVDTVAALKKEAGEQLSVLGISADTDLAAFDKACKELGADWPQVCDGRGFHADLLLRWHVETVPTLVVLGRDGKVAGLNLHVGNEEARRELGETVRRAVRAGAGG
jgi:peroxiredoxin